MESDMSCSVPTSRPGKRIELHFTDEKKLGVKIDWVKEPPDSLLNPDKCTEKLSRLMNHIIVSFNFSQKPFQNPQFNKVYEVSLTSLMKFQTHVYLNHIHNPSSRQSTSERWVYTLGLPESDRSPTSECAEVLHTPVVRHHRYGTRYTTSGMDPVNLRQTRLCSAIGSFSRTSDRWTICLGVPRLRFPVGN